MYRRALLLLLAAVPVSCASSSMPDSTPGTDAMTTTPPKGDGGSMMMPGDDSGDPMMMMDAKGGISGGGTGFTDVMQMFNYVNQTRQQYSNHIPYDGYPFQGMNAQTMTWAKTLTWDASLAAKAQTEADRLANGGKPNGAYFPFQNDGNGEGFYTTGLNSPEYWIASRADGALPQFKNAYGQLEPPHHFCNTANGMYRMAVAYQTGTGNFNKKTKLGVGATEGGTNITWWVLLFGE
jgi:hypothetical protein